MTLFQADSGSGTLRRRRSVLPIITACSTGLLLGLLGGATAGEPESVRTYQAQASAWRIAAGDLNGDRRPEVVYAGYDGSVTCQDERSGALRWKYATGAFPFDLAVRDIDGDRMPETLVASADGRLHVISADGELRWVFASSGPLYQVEIAHGADGVRVLTGGAEQKLYVLGPDGALLTTRPWHRAVRLIGSGDLDGDTLDEVVLAGFNGRVEALTGPNLDLLWRTTLRATERDSHRDKGLWYPLSMCMDDLDGDRRCELLFGSGLANDSGIQVLNSDGSVRWVAPGGFTARGDGSRIAHTIVRAYDVDPSHPGREIVTLTAQRIVVFTQHGARLSSAVSPVPFTDFCVTDDGGTGSQIFFASSPNGDDRIYCVGLQPGWQRALARLGREGRMGRITSNLDVVRRQVLNYAGSATDRRKYVHLVAAGTFKTVDEIRSHCEIIRFYRDRFPYANCVFAMHVNAVSLVAAGGGIPDVDAPKASAADKALPPEQILRLVSECEAGGIPFLVTVGHGCRAHVELDLVREILQTCPNTCLGFLSSENSDHGDRLERYLKGFWYPLMDLCKIHSKKAFLVEGSAWWMTVPAMQRFHKLIDGTYADVLVPSVEDAASRSPELNLSARCGLFLGGAVNAWSARTVRDELCWNWLWQWAYPMTGHPFLRRQMAQALLGASSFDYQIEAWAHGELTVIGTESQELLIHMIGKGLLIPPGRDEMIAISPFGIRMREPTAALLTEVFDTYRRAFTLNPQQRDSPFEGMALHAGAAPVRENYIGSYLFQQDRHALNFVPATPFGFPVIVPKSMIEKPCLSVKKWWETDGTWFYERSQRLSGSEARPQVLSDFRTAAAEMPFRAEGHVFMQAQRISERVYRLTLIDPGILDPADRAVVLHLKPQSLKPPMGGISMVHDLLSDESLPVERDHTVSLIVPAGVFRILTVRFDQSR